MLEDAELESELEAILSSINKKTDNILPDTTSVVTSSAENVPEALQTTSVEAVVEKNVTTAFPQVPTAPIIPLPPKHEVILSRTAVPS